MRLPNGTYALRNIHTSHFCYPAYKSRAHVRTWHVPTVELVQPCLIVCCSSTNLRPQSSASTLFHHGNTRVMSASETKSSPAKFRVNFITLAQHHPMSGNQNMDSQRKTPGVSARGVEKFKIASHGNSAFSRKENIVALKKKLDGSSFSFSRVNRSPIPNIRLKPIRQDLVLSQIQRIVPRPRSMSDYREADNKTREVIDSCVHPRPPKDTHYPFNAVRKNRTKMRCPVCVWCGVQKFMMLTGRPKLKIRASGSDADWERWHIELNSNQSNTLGSLTRSVMPKSELLRFMTESQLDWFYKDFAGALIEMVLRELREGVVGERAIMAQVRSSKYHKTERVAEILSRAYEKTCRLQQ